MATTTARRVRLVRCLVAAVVVASVAAAVPSVASAQQEGFSDVSGGSHKPAIDALNALGLFDGTLCGEDMFCPNEPMQRTVMAVWLVRALDGTDPAAVDSTRFADVDGSHDHAGFIERFAQLGVTIGCKTDPLRYCPDDTVTRAQMATFLVRAFDLEAAEPFGFTDTAGGTHSANIDALAAAGVTVGCRTDPLLYCPTNTVTRAQMATFLARAQGLITAPTPAEPATYSSVTSGRYHSCAIRTDGTIACWGSNRYGQANAPDGVFAALTAGGVRTCGLRTDGTMECWGSNDYSHTDAPTGKFTAVSAGWGHSCGIREDGAAECWDSNYDARSDAPDGGFSAVSSSDGYHSCGLRTDGTVTCWGTNDSGQTDTPNGQFNAVTAGFRHTCGLRTDGTVTCWGTNDSGQTDTPNGQFNAVTAGFRHTCGLRTDSTIDCWGTNDSGQTDTPNGQFNAVTAGWKHSCGLRTDGTIDCWGTNDSGQTDVPTVIGSDVETGPAPTETDPGAASPYNACTDASIDEKPLTCFTDVSYPRDFLQRFRSRPDNCWIRVGRYAYNITQGSTGYEYPGEGDIYELCGQHATTRFNEDGLGPPPIEHLAGLVRR